jgi:hypothetical protein
LVFFFGALIWSGLMVADPKKFDVPMMALSAIILMLFLVKVMKTLWLHAAKTRRGLGAAVAASVAGMGLSLTVGRAVWSGLFTSSQPFLRTPKREGSAAVVEALASVRVELTLFLCGAAAAAAVARVSQPGDVAAVIWIAALIVQSMPHGVAVFAAVISGLSRHQRPVPFEQDTFVQAAE